MFGKWFGWANGPNKTVASGGNEGSPLTRKSPDFQGFSYAPEWTRTTTSRKAHKALNRIRAA
jgi:hypothetical protein